MHAKPTVSQLAAEPPQPAAKKKRGRMLNTTGQMVAPSAASPPAPNASKVAAGLGEPLSSLATSQAASNSGSCRGGPSA